MGPCVPQHRPAHRRLQPAANARQKGLPGDPGVLNVNVGWYRCLRSFPFMPFHSLNELNTECQETLKTNLDPFYLGIGRLVRTLLHVEGDC